jgi:Right handed beta helix region
MGGGVAMNTAGSPLLEKNQIFSNSSDFGPGGGIWIVNTSPLLIQNLIFRNTAQFGGGIYIYSPSTSYQAIFVNNTFAGNVGNGQGLPGDGSAMYVVGYDEHVEYFNNIFASSAGRESFFCAPAGALPPLTDNDGFSTSGNGFGGNCLGVAGTNGNISTDPQFVKPASNHYQLKKTSPDINTGDNSAPDLPAKDLRGKPRIVGGNVDMGVYEFQ